MKTPQIPTPKLSAALGIPNEVWLKREDLHKYGSHKGRSIPTMITEHHKAGDVHFVVSSSGNAALAAILCVQAHNNNKPNDPITLEVLVGNKIDSKKLELLSKTVTDPNITITQVENPKQTAFQLEKNNQKRWLRQSTDDIALVGYSELAADLAKIPNLSAVFIPTSSGTTAQGVYAGFAAIGINPEIHIVQTTTCHPMVETVEPSSEESIAGAIVDLVAHRKGKVLEVIKSSRGSGWVATNEEITNAIKLVKDTAGLTITPNSALSIAGLAKALSAGKTWSGPIVCLITGR